MNKDDQISPIKNKSSGKKRMILIIIAILLIICIIVSISYAYWLVRKNQESSNVIKTGCLSISLKDKTDAINLLNAFPISDEDASALSPYEFILTNSCSTSVEYTISLEILDDANRLDSKYVAVDFNDTGKQILTSYTSVEPTYKKGNNVAVEARKLLTGTIEGKEELSYTIKLWIDQDVTSEDAMEKTFTGKISVIGSAGQITSYPYLVNYITSLAATDTTNLVSNDGTDDHNIRYIGSNPDNYLCFNEECTNGKWRVIGVMKNMTTLDGEKSLVKIVSVDSIGSYEWNSHFDDWNGGDWASSSLNTYLNGELWNTYLAPYSNLIESVTWNFGASIGSSLTASEYYTYERGTQSNYYCRYDQIWTGKVALMYPSDYGFATSGGDTGRDTCLTYNLYNWDSYSDCYSNDYLYDSYYNQWTIIPFAYSDSVFMIKSEGLVSNQYVWNSGAVKPSLYLVSDVQILSGSGTSDDPWIIGIDL